MADTESSAVHSPASCPPTFPLDADLQCEANHSADDSELAAPEVGAFDAEKLLRMAIVSSSLLTQEAMRRIDVENAPVPA